VAQPEKPDLFGPAFFLRYVRLFRKIMENQTITFCWLDRKAHADLSLPSYKTPYAAGMDICAAPETSITLDVGQRVLVNTGLAVAIPHGYEIQVRPRSGLAVRHGITVINSPGTIDSDYRGEIKIALINLGERKYVVHRGDRIAQLVVAPVMQARVALAEELDTTIRGTGGFGHTGV
jgi:dUTP pyrophosphatase